MRRLTISMVTEQTEKDYQEKLSSQEYKVLRKKGTERAFSGKYHDMKDEGMYKCKACGAVLFSSDAKFDSGTGWPSFDKPENTENIILQPDNVLGMKRTEVICKNCGSHLGHVFDDGPKDTTGQRFCINSCALDFEKKD